MAVAASIAVPVCVVHTTATSCSPSPVAASVTRTRRRAKCLCTRFPSPKFALSCVMSCVALVVLTACLFRAREPLLSGLLWLDHQDEWTVCAVFLVLYTAVSFPMTWGYVVLNLACGYHYGLVAGTLVTAVAASAGIVFAHLLMKHYFVGAIAARLLGPGVLRATLAALESAHAFKLIAISRLTPIPFGLQNALFALSPVCVWRYVCASALGLFPTQLLSVYLGTTVRSMEQALSVQDDGGLGYGVLILQVCVSVALLSYIVRRARQELHRSVQQQPADLNRNYLPRKVACGDARLCLLRTI